MANSFYEKAVKTPLSPFLVSSIRLTYVLCIRNSESIPVKRT